ncbi:hypothetical protein [Mycobacterium sp. AZCC_0083]|uniref:hypothetical protein n=1 Tax=Mycobacterium sp. AZCC_0083 TaxID=2735882 RepID=UPI001618E3AB|nr:hypothetical protein [Mycobacterium sp. AZCC_0083]MBB5163564.1 hypothetical protein [Mycobacterium sp. AZCC_0083]
MTRSRAARGWLSLIIATAVVALSLTGCGFPNRRGAADAIDKAIRTMPGVANTDIRYDTSFDGGAYFSMTVTLTAQTSHDQAARSRNARTHVRRSPRTAATTGLSGWYVQSGTPRLSHG